MDYLRPPHFDSGTPDEKFRLIEDYLFILTQNYNNTISELEHEIEKLQEAQNGNIH